MTIGALSFLSPWLLAGLLALPAIYWLLRAIPPMPNRVYFPATRLLKGLKSKDQETAKSPWWLTLMRMLAAACVIFALADPILNPKTGAISGSGPVSIIIDNGWGAAPEWDKRLETASAIIDQAERSNRPVTLIPTATTKSQGAANPETAQKAKDRLAAITPQPHAPDRMAALAKLAANSDQQQQTLVWISDSLDYGKAEEFKTELTKLAESGTDLRIVTGAQDDSPLAVRREPSVDGKLTVTVLRTEPQTAGSTARQGTVIALNKRGQQLASQAFVLPAGDTSTKASFDLPLELRNQINRVVVANQKSAGAIHLLDASSQWNRIGLVSGAAQEKAQPLLAPLYYINKALRPFGDIVQTGDASIATALPKMLEQKTSTIFIADIGTIAGSTAKTLEQFMSDGGVVVRFAGPRLEKSSDALLPAPLRFGGRTLGGALSWSEPQALAPFDEESIFAGLRSTPEVTVSRQVLADPARLPSDLVVWARLVDGTPLVTARKQGRGWLVLFHITANSDWSNLPLSGLFVEMLRRLTTLAQYDPTATPADGTPTPKAPSDGGNEPEKLTAVQQQKLLTPVQIVNGFGELTAPTPTSVAATAKTIRTGAPSAQHPPGFYGAQDNPVAFNLITPKTKLISIGDLPSQATVSQFAGGSETRFKPWLLFAAIALLFGDILATMLLRSGTLLSKPARAAAAMLLFSIVSLTSFTPPASAQQSGPSATPPAASTPPTVQLSPADKARLDAFAVQAVSQTRFAFVITGDAELDRVSEAGLTGLSRMVTARTAVEPQAPVGVNIDRDELAFFPILYWPVPRDAQPLPEKTRARVETYMKRGGMIIFDTRDANTQIKGLPSQGRQTPLQRLLQNLDVPPLEPVPEKHVLTRSFYLLSSFPGRWANGEMWVEAQQKSAIPGERQASKADGVTTIIVTGNDLAAAWALDNTNRPMFTVVPGGEIQREMAFRVGVNIIMYALTGNYKADQVHIPALLERLGQ